CMSAIAGAPSSATRLPTCSLFPDQIDMFKGGFDPGFEVGKKVHRTLPCIGWAKGSNRPSAWATAAYRKSGVGSNNRLWALMA
ncbi:hypothetical protein, partial [Rhizobium johnstonii]|uniref:hypothetical protein n=1 Tax=Rhizobium johnstonii TaxID=3019933 RepID=UPI003F9E3D4B